MSMCESNSWLSSKLKQHRTEGVYCGIVYVSGGISLKGTVHEGLILVREKSKSTREMGGPSRRDRVSRFIDGFEVGCSEIAAAVEYYLETSTNV